MADVRTVLQRCDPVLLEPCGDSEPDCAEAGGMVLFLTDSRRVQKVLWRQLFVLDSMMSLLEGLESAQQLMTQPRPPQPEGGARDRWKSLKVDMRMMEEETETLLRSLQDRVQQVHERRNTLIQLVQQIRSKKEHHDHLQSSLLKSQNALRSCDRQLTQLKAESEAVFSQLIGWQQLRDQLQLLVSASQDVMEISLITFDQSELCVELRPRPSSSLSTNQLEPLRLKISWSHDDRFRLQVEEGTSGLVEDCVAGRWAELSAALQEVLQSYAGQAEMLSEIQVLRSSFAIDWRPSQRHAGLPEDGVAGVSPAGGGRGTRAAGGLACCPVRRDGHPVDTSGLKPQKADLSLTEWLVFLCSSSLV
ncbi:uncharacterized protein si:dkey-225f5.4 isoform X2 [Melanotaenia boesemani]|uniref:uncharacterized protein si:dkey-225f5.4 isoform X2 n=1 Tax=Melanotaenia boesemani TaxID=1250792 RepID=UPI001C03E001|nr:uncharacterized protein si:dkey-225f5.4 isoform X2 [Melanotaenia boesemani]